MNSKTKQQQQQRTTRDDFVDDIDDNSTPTAAGGTATSTFNASTVSLNDLTTSSVDELHQPSLPQAPFHTLINDSSNEEIKADHFNLPTLLDAPQPPPSPQQQQRPQSEPIGSDGHLRRSSDGDLDIVDDDIGGGDSSVHRRRRRHDMEREISTQKTSVSLYGQSTVNPFEQSSKLIIVRPQEDGAGVVTTLNVQTIADLHTTLKELEGVNAGSHVWVDVTTASNEHIDIMCARFLFHPLTVEDCHISPIQLEQEKLEVFSQLKYAFVQTLALNDHFDVDAPVPVKLVVFDQLLVSFHVVPVDPLTRYLQWYSRQPVSKLDTSYTVYGLMKTVTSQLVQVVQSVSTEIDAIEELIEVLSHSERSDLSLRMGRVRRHIVHCRNLLEPKGRVIRSMMRFGETKGLAWFSNPHLLHDLLDQNSVLASRLNISQDLVASIQNMYLARASLAVADASHRLNTAMSRLSVVATITLPLTLITSFWGMNVTVPGQTDGSGEGSIRDFLIIVVIELFLLAAGIHYFHKNGYL